MTYGTSGCPQMIQRLTNHLSRLHKGVTHQPHCLEAVVPGPLVVVPVKIYWYRYIRIYEF